MPHMIVKLHTGKSEQRKARIAEEVTKGVMEGASCAEQSVSVSIEDIEPQDWADKVYHPDITDKWDKLYKKPEYNPQLRPRRSAGEPAPARTWSAGSLPSGRIQRGVHGTIARLARWPP